MKTLDQRERRRMRMLTIKALFLAAAFASFLFSVILWFRGDETEAIFVGLWVPSIHSLGTLFLAGESEAAR